MTIKLTQSALGFYVDTEYESLLSQLGLNSLSAVFEFDQGENLVKSNLAAWRHRIRFQLPDGQYAYLKRYNRPPKNIQFKAWLQHGKRSFLSEYDKGPAVELQQAEVSIPQVIAYGGRRQGLFEAQSFIITLELKNACSLEKKLPCCFHSATKDSFHNKKAFIEKLADFVRRFHETGYRHRDLYLAHLFLSETGNLFLIDLHRTFKPSILSRRYQIKDLSQLHYSSPANTISTGDRIRFYRCYAKITKLSPADKSFLQKIHAKALRIARHDRKHGRIVPFEKSPH